MATLNRWFTVDTVMWSAAAVSLVLLLLTVPVASVVTSGRRDVLMRLAKILFYVVLLLLFLFPCLVLLTGEVASGLPCGLYLLFFPLFCYYMGRRLGSRSGEQHQRELFGLDLFDSPEEVQDRLYESRLRFPSPVSVSDSIVELSRSASSHAATDPVASPPSPSPGKTSSSAVMEVEVEEV